MIDLDSFNQIQDLKRHGLTRHQVSVYMDISPTTVGKYWDMDENEFREKRKKMHKAMRRRKCDKYRTEIIKSLELFPNFNSKQIFDQLEEKYGSDLDVSQRTVHNYVQKIKEEQHQAKSKKKSDYSTERETEFGEQAQVDFGEITAAFDYDRTKRTRLYYFCIILSRSRYKYVYWQDHPFSTQDTIEAHEKAFEYFEGQPKEIIYGRNVPFVVEENNEEVIFTQDFSDYLKTRAFTPRVSRKAEPLSKRKVESVVRYVKNNFARGRKYRGIEQWNEECEAWLERRGNGKENQTTKKIPAEVFSVEKDYLLPISTDRYNVSSNIIPYSVQKDNTISYHSNRYELPEGTYDNNEQVGVQEMGRKIVITDLEDQHILQIHELCDEKGQLITIPEKGRPIISVSAQKLRKQLEDIFDNSREIKHFTKTICQKYARFAYKQFKLIIETCDLYDYHPEIIVPAIELCVDADLESAHNFVSCCRHYAARAEIMVDEPKEYSDRKTLSEYQHEDRLKKQRSEEQAAYPREEAWTQYGDELSSTTDVDIYADYRQKKSEPKKIRSIIDDDVDLYADYR